MSHIFFQNKLLPAVTIPNANTGLSVAEALLEGGLNIMEVTFRTSATAEAVSVIAKEFPEMNVGAGTILSTDQVSAAKNAGAKFGLAPGLNENIIKEAGDQDFPFIPGVMTPSEIERALELDCKLLKLFPASDLGGVDFIHSLEGPYSHTGVKFLPMGGIDLSNIRQYLQCESVIAAGGSWMTPGAAIAKGKFQKITKLVRDSLKVAGGYR